MSNVMNKIGDKLHIGGRKKEDPSPEPSPNAASTPTADHSTDVASTPTEEQSPAPPSHQPPMSHQQPAMPHQPAMSHQTAMDHTEVQPVRPEIFNEPIQTKHEGPLDKIKQKLHVGKKHESTPSPEAKTPSPAAK